jgi:ABC-type bacteriocin/lantibiotic exporter with double-glycine peptidase domain
MDLISGLYKPTIGKIFCDEIDIQSNLRSWYRNIGYVPQHIHLFDNSIKMNIAFGLDDSEVNVSRVYDCLKMSRLEKWANSLEKGIETLVGDKGIRISGGQRQRIGIARALYNNPKILFFDESSNSLDLQTENELMQEVNTLLKNITKIIISHRLVTLKNCDIIYLIKDGKILSSGDYNKISNLRLSN